MSFIRRRSGLLTRALLKQKQLGMRSLVSAGIANPRANPGAEPVEQKGARSGLAAQQLRGEGRSFTTLYNYMQHWCV